MAQCQLAVHFHCEVVNFLLAVVNILPKRLGILAMAGLACAINLGQWTLHMVIGEFDATLLHVRHVAVGATQSALPMNALLEKFVTGMLCLKDFSL